MSILSRSTMAKRRMASAVGFTLIEVILAGMVLVIAISAILGAYTSQVTLNEHARNLSLAMNDATRVIEQIRQQNSPCNPGPNPSAVAPICVGSVATWDSWLQQCSGGKSVWPVFPQQELVVMTPGAGTPNPLLVTVAICWRHRNRTIGECAWNGTALSANPAAGGDPAVTESPAMLTTKVTCR